MVMTLLRWQKFDEFENVAVYNMSGIPYQIWLRFNQIRVSVEVSQSMMNKFDHARTMMSRFKMGVESGEYN